MANFLPPKDPVLKGAWIERAPPEAVAGWLSQVHPGLFGTLFPSNALETLIARRNGYIDLAVALYGDAPNVLRELWERGDHVLRRAILTNQNRDRYGKGLLDFLDEREALLNFLATASIEEISVLVTNSTLKAAGLSAIFGRVGVFADIPISQWRTIAAQALQNPNLHRKTNVNFCADYTEEDQLSESKARAMQLLLEFPVDDHWEWLLASGYAKFTDFNIPITTLSEVQTLAEFSESRDQSERAFLDAVFTRWTSVELLDEERKGFQELRMDVAALAANRNGELRLWLESYPDKWVQIGAARMKRFRTQEEVQEWFDRHGWDLLKNIEANQSMHSRDNAEVVLKVRSLVEFSEDRAERDGIGREDREMIRSCWMSEASRFHQEAPDRYCGWDEDIGAATKQDAAPPNNPILARLDEILNRLKCVEESVSRLKLGGD